MFISIHAEKHCTKPFCNEKERKEEVFRRVQVSNV